MNTDTYDWLTRLVEESIEHPLTSDWEKGFMTDQQTRLNDYGTSTLFSAKQWAVVTRIANKIDFESPPDDFD